MLRGVGRLVQDFQHDGALSWSISGNLWYTYASDILELLYCSVPFLLHVPHFEERRFPLYYYYGYIRHNDPTGDVLDRSFFLRAHCEIQFVPIASRAFHFVSRVSIPIVQVTGMDF